MKKSGGEGRNEKIMVLKLLEKSKAWTPQMKKILEGGDFKG